MGDRKQPTPWNGSPPPAPPPAPPPRLQQLRVDPDRTWEYRGKADKAVVADTLRTLMGAAAADPYVKHLEQAIDALDRTP